MRTLFRFISLLISILTTFSQGILNFHNRGQHDPSMPPFYDAWVTLPDGTRAAGNAFTAGLYLVNPNDTLTLLATSPFRTGPGAGLIVQASTIPVPGHPPFSPATFRARVWETVAGSFENAAAAGMLHGEFPTRFPNNNIPIAELGTPFGIQP